MEMRLENLEHHWMPFTNNREFKREPRLFERASGMHYWTPTGRKILDGSSGLFTTPAGHCRAEIATAVAKQLQTLDFAPSFMRGHPGAFALADGVAALTPKGLDHVFFCNSGSEAVDTAMKIALAYHLARNEGQRTYFVSRERAYHGVNIGGTALSGMVRNLVGEKRIAAVFVEPIAGSTGVLVPPRGYLERLREISTRYGILLVFDEVICG